MNQCVISKKNIKRWNSRNKVFIFVFMFTGFCLFSLFSDVNYQKEQCYSSHKTSIRSSVCIFCFLTDQKIISVLYSDDLVSFLK